MEFPNYNTVLPAADDSDDHVSLPLNFLQVAAL